MIKSLKTRAFVVMVGAALTLDQAMAMSWLFPDKGSGGHGPKPAPELDGAGAIAVFALVVSVAIVLFNRIRNR